MRRDDPRFLSNEAPAIESLVAEALQWLRRAVQEYAPVALASSLGAEDMLLTDLIWRHDLPIEIFTLDTGRLPIETHALLARVERHYGRRIQLFMPNAEEVEHYVAQYGINGFYDSLEARKACCSVRKIAPLRRALAGRRAWVTGLRREQSPTREAVAALAWDASFGLVKLNPLIDWKTTEVWAYLRQHEVPWNALHDRGYPSIGCAPCTRAVAQDEDIRAGRWWWESPSSKECGLHLVDGRLQRKVEEAQ